MHEPSGNQPGDSQPGSNAGFVIAQRYELLDEIGKGGQGTVHRARDRKTDSLVAVKILPREVAQDPSAVERMVRELRAIVSLEGTNVPRFIDFRATRSGRLCLVMEFLEGTNLEAELQRLMHQDERFSVEDTLRIMNPIADTLHVAHEAGIIHRDLKPANVFLVSENAGGGSRLLDFGLARLQSSKKITELGQVMGSPSYIAPEVWKGKPDAIDRRVDVYALGVVLFRMLSGQVPFAGATLREHLLQVTTADRPSLFELRPELPRNIDIWVERALAIERDDRYPNVMALWNELRWALGLQLSPFAERKPEPSAGIHYQQVRGWLADAWVSLPEQVTRIWRVAAQVLKRSSGGASEASSQDQQDQRDQRVEQTKHAADVEKGEQDEHQKPTIVLPRKPEPQSAQAPDERRPLPELKPPPVAKPGTK